jgi:hypothetical protein
MWRFSASFYPAHPDGLHDQSILQHKSQDFACCGCFCFWAVLSLPETPQQTCTECLAMPCTRTHPVRPADALGAAQTSVERANP